MPTFRLTQRHIKDDDYRIDLTFEQYETATVDVTFSLPPDDQERIRWYLEDYLENPSDPHPKIAARIERKMREIGVNLFTQVFQGNDDARDLWAGLRQRLHDTRIELVTGVREAAAIPWELLRDPKTDAPLALRAQGFVRTYSSPAQRPSYPSRQEQEADSSPVRILLAICRPGGEEDVPFRSVAMKILKGLSEKDRELFQLDVLRPPTFERLSDTLRRAKEAGAPYHVVHFDGHGAFLDLERLLKSVEAGIDEEMLKLLRSFDSARFSPQALYSDGKARSGKQGYLCFENAKISENMRLVDGSALGRLLVESDVPLLILNACRSAHAENGKEELTPRPPLLGREGETLLGKEGEELTPQPPLLGKEGEDVHCRVRAFGSLAQEVMDCGVAGVVAMRYNVYVVTAAQFVADLYAALARGNTLGEAVTFGRKQLQADPLREIAYDPIPLQDWIVPVAYESAPVALFPKPSAPERNGGGMPELQLNVEEKTPDTGLLDPELPREPDVGFFGRDATLLTLERAFDTQNVALLHAYAGSGKTATSAEFARWYSLTGGVNAVLFSSFERHQTLAQVLGTFEKLFGPLLEQNNIHFLALDAAQQRNVALQVMRQVPLLWIWDNVEPIAGFPAGAESSWSAAEQRELLEFLRDCRGTRAKILLTSRRDERGWLGELPCRVRIPGMPMRERVQLAQGIAAKYHTPLNAVADWQPLLHFTRGNPLSITVLVGQALRDGLRSREQIAAFVDKLRAGEAEFDDEAEEGRSKSLGASLQYGFSHAFNDAEQKKLALLHFFQGFVDADALKWMSRPGEEWSLPEIQDTSKEEWIELLDRAAEIGLLTRLAPGYYTIHPALPWYFKSLFDRLYLTPRPPLLEGEGEQNPSTPQNKGTQKRKFPLSSQERGPGGEFLQAARAFVEAMGQLGNYYFWEYEGGNRDVIGPLGMEEANLLFARHLARRYGWWDPVTSAMQGLRQLYEHTGRRSEWRHLVQEIVPDFVAGNDGPLPGREEQWSLVTGYRVVLAREARQWGEAERGQRVCVEWDRRQAAAALDAAPEALESTQRNQIRTLAASLHDLAQIQREIGEPDCVEAYKESLTLSEQIDEQAGAAICAFNLGHAYMQLPKLRDLEQAEAWCRRSLELRADGDRLGRSKCYSALGYMAYERFKEARAAEQPQEELAQHLQDALEYYHKALDLIPPNAAHDLAVAHNQLGLIYRTAGDLDRALSHSWESIRYTEATGNLFQAGQIRCNVALALQAAGRTEDALLYAQAALRNHEPFGESAAADIQKAQELIEELQE